MPMFISKPNNCDGCPIRDAPVKLKIGNLCYKWDPKFEVKYKLDNLGHTICQVKRKTRKAPPRFQLPIRR